MGSESSQLKGIKVFIAHDDGELREDLSEMFKSFDSDVVGVTNSQQVLMEDCVASPPDLIVTSVHLNGGDGIEALLKIAESVSLPSLIVAKEQDIDDIEKAMKDHVMGYLIAPVDRRDMESTAHVVLRRFQQFQELESEVKRLKGELATRKKLERAKGIVIERYGFSEEEAYLRIRDIATKRRIKLVDVCDIIIDDSLTNQ